MSVMPWGPERPAGQGIGPAQQQSATRVIRQLLTDPVVGEQVDLVLCHRQGETGDPPAGDGHYEAWARRGMVCFRRVIDGQTARVCVRENDRLASGERPAVEGAQVVVDAHHPSGEVERIAQGTTADLGIFGFATPVEIASQELWIEVSAQGFNPRRIRLDGTSKIDDLRSELYSAPEDA